MPHSHSTAPGQAQLEAQLALMTTAIARCFEQADAPDHTEYRTQRRDEIENAVRLLSLSGNIGQALAKLKGEFRHQISVLRDPQPVADLTARLEPLLATPTPSPAK